MVFIGYIRHGYFNKAKLMLAKHCQMTPMQSTYAFFRNEVEYVLKHFTFLVENICESSCSNGSLCPEPTKLHTFKDFPVVAAKEVGQFQQICNNWIKGLHVSPCRLEITGEPKENIVEWIPKR